jgi:hypothetical protein
VLTLLESIGKVLVQKKEYQKASDNYLQQLKQAESIGNKLVIGSTFAELTRLALYQDNLEQAQDYLQQLETISQEMDNKPLNQETRLVKALFLKASPRIVNKGKAMELLRTIVKEEDLSQELTREAILHLCDMLLTELRQTTEESILEEIKPLVVRLMEMAENQDSYSLLAETKLLQSQIALLELDLSKAKQLLYEAQILADEKGLKRLAVNISNTHDTLIDQLAVWQEIEDQNISLSDRLETVQLQQQLERLLTGGELRDVPQEEAVLLLILNRNGLNFYSRKFLPESKIQEQLISGFLSAINSFIKEAFSTSGVVERIKHREYTVFLEAKDSLLIAYVYKGPSYYAVKKIRQFIDLAMKQETLWDNLQNKANKGGFVPGEQEIKKLDELTNTVFKGSK